MTTPKFFDLMVDIECMGLPPSGALLSIGAVFFDLHTQTLGPTFLRTVNLATAVRDGGTMTPSTVIWWLGQSDEARKGVRFGGQDVRTVLADFSTWIEETCRHEDVRPWGNSAGFDLTIVSGAYQRAGMPTPWYWTQERCFRTVRNLYPQVAYNPEEKGTGAHNALADAEFQARHLFAIKTRNQAKKETAL